MKNRLKKCTAILLCAILLIGILPVTSVSAANSYYNVGYLENYAAAAYQEEGLGASYTPQATTWKVWSPTAAHVQVRLYATGSDDEEGAKVLGTSSMVKNPSTGVWSLTLTGDYKDVYYTYLVTVRGVTRETRDIYAKAAGVNGDRSMVVDLDATDPQGWQNDEHVLLDESTDAVIWEVHVRDFSISPTSGVSEDNRGKYLAFTEENTTVNGEGDFSTCLDYLKEMGVNTVHLLPVYDFGSVDETNPQDWIETTMEEALSEGEINGQYNPNYYRPERNWGYDPNNYNVPEGSYSSDPKDGNVRITEFKRMIQALHEAGISVVMDVVYNHTYDCEDLKWGRVLHNNAFNDTVPGYYFRLNNPLSWINGSGCGNVTASDKLMYRKYMVESVHYWAEEYHIDGFRFDLMACHDAATMNAIRADLDSMYGGEGEKILMYGEPWDGSFGGGTGIADGATVDNATPLNLSERIAMFCAWMRDGIKGNPDGTTWGWIQGDTSQSGAIFGGLTANDGRLTARSQTVTYADAHDNLILWDKILNSNGSSAWDVYTGAAAEKYLKQLNLAKTIVLMSQGMAFNVAGTEFARTKLGCHNSYKAGDNINAIDWKVRETNAASADYYKGLIQIRKAFSPITDPRKEYQKNQLEGSSDSCIAVRIPNETPGEWSDLILILNDVPGSATVTLPEGSWTLIANGIQAGLTSLGTCSGTYTVPGYGSAILVQGSNGSKKAAAPADEQSLNGGDKIYLNLGAVDWWLNDGAVTRLHFFNNAGGADWAETSLVEGSVYSANIPDGDWSHIILVRCNPAYTGTDYWSEECKWNQTGNLELPAEGNYLISFANDSDEATWGTYNPGTEPDPDPDPENPDYYLTGSMNGWTYPDPAYKLSFAANGEYILSNVALEKDTQLQIVDSNGQWYPGGTNYQVTENGYYDVSFYPAGQHAGYHGGYFKLTKVADYEPPVTEIFYYLTGQFAGWGINDAYKLTRVGETDEYVLTGVSLSGGEGVKVTSSKGLWYPDPGGNYIVPDTGVYDLSFYPGGGQPRPEYYEGYFKLTKVGGGESGDHSGANDKVILHCWNWSYDTIRENLAAIKAAGYTMVQTSPAQPHSGYHTGFVPTGDWWMLYQPLGLHIAEEGESWLGSEADLKNLCEAAHELGIEVIVDVVSNHLCNGYNDIYAAGTDPYDDSQIIADDGNGKKGYQFEVRADSRVYEHNPELSINDFRTEYIFCNDTNTEATVHGNIGMPDLKTETTNVQTSVLNYLKELVDAGVDGFRFDAAKHIETPSDKAPYASEFWPTVINGAQDYAAEKYDKELWSYGEVLSTAGHDRKMNYYSEYIDMTEISYAYTITQGFGDHKGASTIANQLFKDWLGVGVEALAPTDLVLMAESHDMYAGEGFHQYSSEVINKAWAVAVARADASSLYFARPEGFTQADGCVGTLGACDDYNWMDVEVAEANKFHAAFIGADEAVYAADNFVVVERYNGTDCGAVLVNANDTIASVNIHSQNLTDGKYYDQITGSEFTVSSGWISGEIGTTGIAVLRSTPVEDCEHPAENRYNVTKEATCTEEGYVAVYCGKCGRLVEISSVTPALGHIDENNDERCDRCNTFLGTVSVYFVDELDWVNEKDHFTNVNSYAYGDGGENLGWPGQPAELVGRTTENHGIWKIELNPEAYQTVIFVGHPGESEEVKTANLPFAADAEAAGKKILIYKPTGGTVAGEYGEEYVCEILSELKPVCAHTAYTITVNEAGNEITVCDCCGAIVAGNPFVDVTEGKYYYEKVLWAFYHDPQITAGTDATHFSPNASCTRAQIVTFLYAAAGKPEIEPCENPFKDVKEGKWYYNAVMWAVQNGITEGMKPDVFGLNEACTRAQAVTFLYAMAGKPQVEVEENPFTDVPENKWFYNAVMWAVQNGITGGKTPTTFAPNDKCTRAQIVTFLYAAYGD